MIPIIFDLDGTLVHSAPDIHAALNAMLAEEGQPPLDLDTVIGFIGNGVAVLVERVMRHRGIALNAPAHAELSGVAPTEAAWLPTLDPAQHARLTAKTQLYMKTAPARLSVLYPGATQALQALRVAGHPLGLCTNKPQEAAFGMLAALGLDTMFDAVVGGGRLPSLKPDPAMLLLTLSELGHSRAIFVGDSEVDAETAARAEMPFVLHTKGYLHRPIETLRLQAQFDHFAQLPDLIAGIDRAQAAE